MSQEEFEQVWQEAMIEDKNRSIFRNTCKLLSQIFKGEYNAKIYR